MLLKGVALGSLTKLGMYLFHLKQLIIPGSIGSATLQNLTFTLSPSPLFVAMGALIGTRAAFSMLLGALIAWGGIAPFLIDTGWLTTHLHEAGHRVQITLSDPVWQQAHHKRAWFKELVTWLLWPGVAMMVTSSLSSFVISSLKSRSSTSKLSEETYEGHDELQSNASKRELSQSLHLSLLACVILLSIILQGSFFGISWWQAALGVVLTILLAIVAAKVSGETGLTPIGAMGKVTQLSFGVIAPGQVNANLMAANVTGGAASQCADLLHDLKAGLLIGATPRQQTLAQLAGVISGAVCGAIAYLILVGDPQRLNTLWEDPEWAMPAVVQWKAVAELLSVGFDQLPTHAAQAMFWGGVIGILLALLPRLLPDSWHRWAPSPTALGLAFVIPAYYSISIAIGALLSSLLHRYKPDWSKQFMIVLASGVIAGDSLLGVTIALYELIVS